MNTTFRLSSTRTGTTTQATSGTRTTLLGRMIARGAGIAMDWLRTDLPASPRFDPPRRVPYL